MSKRLTGPPKIGDVISHCDRVRVYLVLDVHDPPYSPIADRPVHGEITGVCLRHGAHGRFLNKSARLTLIYSNWDVIAEAD